MYVNTYAYMIRVHRSHVARMYISLYILTIRHKGLENSCNNITMTKSILLTVLFISTVHINAEFSDRIRKASVKLLPLIDSEVNDNFVISPLSIFKLMTSISFDTSGEAKRQIKYAFYLPKNNQECGDGYREMEETLMQPSDGIKLFTQNFLFIDKKLQLSEIYEKKLSNQSSAKPRTIVKKLDFKSQLAVVEANNIIEKSGANISNVLNPNNFQDSRMVLSSVISFKGLWTFPFNESDTMVEPFYDENGKEIGKVNMMYQRFQSRYNYITSLNSFVLELPYGNDERYCMLVVLPDTEISIQDVYKKFESVSYIDIFNHLQSGEDEFGITDVDVKLPRFKISTNVVLNKPLNRMGVTDIFEAGRANFEKITKEDIFISAIVHKADIEVTESGTVASAATSAYFADRIATPSFTASRPFIYLIMEKKTKAVIFSGVYSQPRLF